MKNKSLNKKCLMKQNLHMKQKRLHTEHPLSLKNMYFWQNS